jgi:dolichol-phosphate mannosyltransferase
MSMLNKHFTLHSIHYEVIIVEDNSPDGTLAVAQALRDIYGSDRVTIIPRPGKMGLGSAYMDGLKKCRGDFVFLMDADMSHHPKHMVEFIAKQKNTGADIITGTRYALGGGVAGWDLRRVLTSRGANLLANLLLTPGISDLTGSFRLYKKGVLERLMNSVKGKTYVFQMEVIVRAKQQGYMIAEVPIIFVDRIYGESKLGANEIISYIKGLWALFLDLDY